MSKTNCWEFKTCGRQPGGNQVASLGVCPATTLEECEGVNDGHNAGRACWAVAGTLCGGEVQGSFAVKYENCSRCDFYQQVVEEQGTAFFGTSSIRRLLGSAY